MPSTQTDTRSGSISDNASYPYLTRITSDFTGDVTDITIFLAPFVSYTVELGIYSDVAGSPGILLGSSIASQPPPPDPLGSNVTQQLQSPVSVVSGTVYWLAVVSSGNYQIGTNAGGVSIPNGTMAPTGTLPPTGATFTTSGTFTSTWFRMGTPPGESSFFFGV